MSTLLLAGLLLSACDGSWNNPYPASQSGQNILYQSFDERPKHLDPVKSYSSAEYRFIGHIYEPPLQYHYLKRPYELIPLTAEAVPEPWYLDREGRRLADDASQVAYSVYQIRIKKGIKYQPHPAFAVDEKGEHRYHQLTEVQLENIYTLQDFAHTGSRELTAEDYVYQIKRLAHPRVHSPIFGVMAEYIVGLKEYGKTLRQVDAEQKKKGEKAFIDLRDYPLEGVSVMDRYTYQIRLKGKYPQLRYWLAMPFFAPMPVEADRFYFQPGLEERNITLDWYPVGTGAYMLTVNNPNRQMILERNPHFRGMPYPAEGAPGDEEKGLLKDAGKTMPFIDRVIFSLEKESIPYWNKFLQGYYDFSGISSDSFDQAIRFSTQGEAQLAPEMVQKDIRLNTAVQTSTYYMGFNMLDPVVGGTSERARLLRRAIAIAVDYEDFISIFANGRGVAAQGAIPPGIFGHADGEQGINPYVYDWVNGRPQRKSIEEAKQLLARAGYPNGRDAKSGEPLLINLDVTGRSSEDKALFDWYRKQFKKIDLQLVIRNTDYNRFQEKMRKGNAQLFQWGWNADYPDPENFLFLLYGPNAKAKHNGENAANYDNPEFNRLFNEMKNMDNSAARMVIIQQMQDIVRRDGPWLWGFHPKSFALYHNWYYNAKPNLMAHNTLMYKRVDPVLRDRLRAEWNKPDTWPILIIVTVLSILLIPAVVIYRRRERLPAKELRK